MSEVENVLDVQVWLPSFLENSEEEISNHKAQANMALKFINDQYNMLISYCENHLALEGSTRSRPTEYSYYETQLKRLQRECDVEEDRVFKLDQCLKSSETELKNLKSKNEDLQDEIVQLSENIDRLATQEEELTKQRKEATESMQLLWRSYVAAKNTYKKNLKCHIRLHEPADCQEEIPSSEHEDSLTFSYLMDDTTILEVKLNRNNSIWKVLDIQPFVPAAVEAQKHLHETSDIRHFMFCLWEEAEKLSKK